MGLTVNTNTAATAASDHLNKSNTLLQKSINRLASGKRIVDPADDAGGLAVSMKMEATIRRTEAVDVNVSNAISFLQSQDGALETASQVVTRIAELRMLYSDPTKNNNDKSNYQLEYTQLTGQLTSLLNEKFNGVNLFQSGGSSIEVITSEDGNTKINVSIHDFNGTLNPITSQTALSLVNVSTINTAIQKLATHRAQNGAESSRLQFTSDMLKINRANLEAANSRLTDTDVALESTRFAKYQILSQSGASMLAQANSTPHVALKLLG
tara:strand:- start:3456 stop:4259 length:804 start_codon:yes stop_codon:yes gene_type:complete